MNGLATTDRRQVDRWEPRVRRAMEGRPSIVTGRLNGRETSPALEASRA